MKQQEYECLGFKIHLMATMRPVEWRGGESGVVIVQLFEGVLNSCYHARMTAYVSQQVIEVVNEDTPEQALDALAKKVGDHARYVAWLASLVPTIAP